MTRAALLICVSLLLAPGAAQGQRAQEEGRPLFLERFTVQDYDAHEQNWWIAQDSRGVVFVANWTAVLEYDGTTWRHHTIPNEFVRSLAISRDDRIFVGGVGEIGYLAPNQSGQYQYRSLTEYLSEDERTFTDVWTTYATDEGVYFQSFRYLFRWDGQEMKVWNADTRFHKSFMVHGQLFVRQEGIGLMVVSGNDLQMVRGGEQFAEERIDAMMPIGPSGWLLATRSRGLIVGTNAGFDALVTDAAKVLRDERVYQGTALRDAGGFALATFAGKVVILDARGQLVRVLGEDVGLAADDVVLFIEQDRQGGLWLALDRGIVRVDVPAAVSVFDARDGLGGLINDVARYHGTMYAATSQGLFMLHAFDGPESRARMRFSPVPGVSSQVWFIQEAGDRLLAASDEGIIELNSGTVRNVFRERTFSILESRRYPGLIYAGLKEGFAALRMEQGKWSILDHRDDLRVNDVRNLFEDTKGNVWLGMMADGVVRMRMDSGRVAAIDHFGSEHGLLGRSFNFIEMEDQTLFLSSEGIFEQFEYNGITRFRPMADAAGLGRSEAVGVRFAIGSGAGDYISRIYNGQISVLRRTNGGHYVDATPPALRFRSFVARYALTDPYGPVWVVTDQGLIRFDPTILKDYSVPYSALVRRVTTRGGGLLFGGHQTARARFPVVEYAQNHLAFDFAAPTFNLPGETLYQYWLEGFDTGWSDWAGATSKEYTNLPEGHYRFHVRALNAQGIVSEIGTFAFRITPPWYRTWWAYLLYLTGGAVILWGYGHWRIREHDAALERERQVRQQIELANERLRKANERLHLADKLKDDLLANTSHELRTPLTSILGFAGVLQDELSGEHREFASHIQQGGQRLLETVNALLDMARFRADLITVDPDDVDIVAEVATVTAALEPLAARKGLFLKVIPEDFSVPARLDTGALERIVANLVGNAIKFTEQGGVTVLIDAEADRIHLTVKDTGIGIRSEFLPHLFSAFSQASSGYSRTHEGNGLGLAITHQLIRVLGGDITVESSEGAGTVFRVGLPRWAALNPEGEGGSALVTHSLRGRRVLLVEQEGQPQHNIRAILGPLALLDVASGLEEALVLAHGQRYDIVMITGHSAEDAAATTLSSLHGVAGTALARYVAITPFSLPGDHEHFLSVGFDEQIGRPFTRDRLLLCLEVLLTQPSDTEPEIAITG
jgi:signal transduction histidine kinase